MKQKLQKLHCQNLNISFNDLFLMLDKILNRGE